MSSFEVGLDSQELAVGLPFPMSQGLNSQELFDTIFGDQPGNDPMLPAIGSQSEEGSRQRLTLTLTAMPTMDDISTPNCNLGTPDLIQGNLLQGHPLFKIVDYIIEDNIPEDNIPVDNFPEDQIPENNIPVSTYFSLLLFLGIAYYVIQRNLVK